MNLPHWGQDFWRLFHTICKSPNLSSDEVIAICNDFCRCLPCPTCRHHFLHLIKQHDINQFASHEHWAWHLHDETNTRLGKRRLKTSYDGTLLPEGEFLPPPARSRKLRGPSTTMPVSKQAAEHRGRF